VSNSTTRTGWTIGGSVETKISEGLIARAEYRYSHFDTSNDQANLNIAGAASPANIVYQLKFHTQIATMGIAYQTLTRSTQKEIVEDYGYNLRGKFSVAPTGYGIDWKHKDK
jgi:hypothetical protein